MTNIKYCQCIYPEKLLKAALEIQREAEPNSDKTGFMLQIVTSEETKQTIDVLCLGNIGKDLLLYNTLAAEALMSLEKIAATGSEDSYSPMRRNNNTGNMEFSWAIAAKDVHDIPVSLSVAGLNQLANKAIAHALAELLNLKFSYKGTNPLLESAREKLRLCVCVTK